MSVRVVGWVLLAIAIMMLGSIIPLVVWLIENRPVTPPPCQYEPIPLEWNQRGGAALILDEPSDIECVGHHVEGDLWIRIPGHVSLPQLRSVDDDLNVYRGTTSVDLPALETAGGIRLSSPNVRTFDAPSLHTVTNILYLTGEGLQRVSLPALDNAYRIYANDTSVLDYDGPIPVRPLPRGPVR